MIPCNVNHIKRGESPNNCSGMYKIVHSNFFYQEKDDFPLRQKAVKALLNDHGQALVHALINACIFCLPTFMTTDFGEVIFELMKIDRPVCIDVIFKKLKKKKHYQ